MTFTVTVKNTGWETSPSYRLECSIWRMVLGGWQKMADFSDEGPPLGLWPPSKHEYNFLYVTEEPGYHEFWAQIRVDGVLLEEDYNWFWVTR